MLVDRKSEDLLMWMLEVQLLLLLLLLLWKVFKRMLLVGVAERVMERFLSGLIADGGGLQLGGGPGAGLRGGQSDSGNRRSRDRTGLLLPLLQLEKTRLSGVRLMMPL